MKDLQFYQYQARGPVVWGDFEIGPTGDLVLLNRDEDIDVQDATVRLLTDQGVQKGFASFPGLGASLSKYVGEPASLDTVQQIDRSCERALRADKRFSAATQVRTVQTGPDSARIYVLQPGGNGGQDVIVPKVDFSTVRGSSPQDEKSPSPWLWRRGLALIQRSADLWRAWLGSSVLWRLSPAGLVVPAVSQSSLSQLGAYSEPLSVLASGLLFCGRGPAEGLYTPRALTTLDGWITAAPVAEVESLPSFADLPDGVWCDEETGWDIVIVVGGQTAGLYSEARSRWEFLSLSLTSSL